MVLLRGTFVSEQAHRYRNARRATRCTCNVELDIRPIISHNRSRRPWPLARAREVSGLTRRRMKNLRLRAALFRPSDVDAKVVAAFHANG